MKKKMNRRTFAKMAAGAALAGAAARETLAGGMTQAAAPSAPVPQEGASRPEPRVKLTSEQEERVKQAVERRERQLNTLRNFKLDYSVEPAFVFKVRR